MHPEEQHLPFKQTGITTIFHLNTNLILGHILIHSVDKTHVLVVTVQLIWLLLLNILSFNFVPTSNKFLRLERIRKSYINRPDVLTNHANYTAFLLDARCTVQCGHVPFFSSCLSPILLHLRNLFLLTTPVARMMGKQTKRCETGIHKHTKTNSWS